MVMIVMLMNTSGIIAINNIQIIRMKGGEDDDGEENEWIESRNE